KNRVELAYRRELQLTLLAPAYPPSLAVSAPASGTIRMIRRRADEGHLLLLVTPEGRREWIFLDPRRPLLAKIRSGVAIAKDEPLSQGQQRQDWLARYLEDRDDLRVELHVKVAHAMTVFLRQGRLLEARWELQVRRATGVLS